MTQQRSLRAMVLHWLAPNPVSEVRITEFRNRRARHECYVRVEAFREGGAVALFFFRHEDGAWQVFPPAPARPTMRVG